MRLSAGGWSASALFDWSKLGLPSGPYSSLYYTIYCKMWHTQTRKISFLDMSPWKKGWLKLLYPPVSRFGEDDADVQGYFSALFYFSLVAPAGYIGLEWKSGRDYIGNSVHKRLSPLPSFVTILLVWRCRCPKLYWVVSNALHHTKLEAGHPTALPHSSYSTLLADGQACLTAIFILIPIHLERI